MPRNNYPRTIKIKESPYGWKRGYVSECGRWSFTRGSYAVDFRVWHLDNAQSRLPEVCRGPYSSLNEARRVAGWLETMERLDLADR